MNISECDCENLVVCPFFSENMGDDDGITELYVKSLCQGGKKEDCARYIVCKALGRENVPKDLYPLELDRAKAILAEAESAARTS